MIIIRIIENDLYKIGNGQMVNHNSKVIETDSFSDYLKANIEENIKYKISYLGCVEGYSIPLFSKTEIKKQVGTSCNYEK